MLEHVLIGKVRLVEAEGIKRPALVVRGFSPSQDEPPSLHRARSFTH